VVAGEMPEHGSEALRGAAQCRILHPRANPAQSLAQERIALRASCGSRSSASRKFLDGSEFPNRHGRGSGVRPSNIRSRRIVCRRIAH
jgi:hypothetical protein